MTHEEMILKAKEAKSAEELLALAKENDIEMTEESANAYFEQLHKSGELSDSELDNVSGGGCHAVDNRLIVTTHNRCSFWVCADCGESNNENMFLWYEHICRKHKDYGLKVLCITCKYCTYERGLWLCNHVDNLG